jgi:transposase
MALQGGARARIQEKGLPRGNQTTSHRVGTDGSPQRDKAFTILDSGCSGCPTARDLRQLALRFRTMLRWRKTTGLAAWMHSAVSSEFHFLAQFARVLRRDLKAVEQAITSRWRNGPRKGHINRLKMIKRQMYGRAGVELLRARVLPWESVDTLADTCTDGA